MDLEREREMQLIGSIMANPKRMVDIVGAVKPSDFKDEVLGLFFAEQIQLWQNKQTPDLVAIGGKYPQHVEAAFNCSGMALPYGEVSIALRIANSAQERRVNIFLAALSNDDTYTAKEKLEKMLGLYNKEIKTDGVDHSLSSAVKRFDKIVQINKANGGMGIGTGFSFFDWMDIQYVKGHTWVITAFTSVGKTSFALQQVINALSTDKSVKVLIVSTEMTEEQVVARLIGNVTDIYSKKILSGNLLEDENEKVERCKAWLKGVDIEIYDNIYDLVDVERAVRRKSLQGGVDMVVVDYVQNMTYSEAKNSYQEGALMAKRLQKLAKDAECTIIALSQVSNDVARGNTDNFEAKGAGEWSAVADIGIQLFKKKDDNRLLKCDVKKNRHGAKGEALLMYRKNFSGMDEYQDEGVIA